MDKQIDLFFENLHSARSASDNLMALWNAMWCEPDGAGRRRIMSEIMHQMETGRESIRAAQALAERLVK